MDLSWLFFFLIGLGIIIISILIYRNRNAEDSNVRPEPLKPQAANYKQQSGQTEQRHPMPHPGMKNCFWCKAEIPQDAIVCQFCGRETDRLMVQSRLLSQIGSSLLIIGLIILGLICLLTGGLGLF